MGTLNYGTSGLAMPQGQADLGGLGVALGLGAAGASGSALMRLLTIIKETKYGQQVKPKITSLIKEFEDSEEKFGDFVHATDKRLNGMGAWELPAYPNVGTTYYQDTSSLAQYAVTNEQKDIRMFGEVNRRINRLSGCVEIVAGFVADLEKKLVREVVGSTEGGIVAVALTGGFTDEPVQETDKVD